MSQREYLLQRYNPFVQHGMRAMFWAVTIAFVCRILQNSKSCAAPCRTANDGQPWLEVRPVIRRCYQAPPRCPALIRVGLVVFRTLLLVDADAVGPPCFPQGGAQPRSLFTRSLAVTPLRS